MTTTYESPPPAAGPAAVNGSRRAGSRLLRKPGLPAQEGGAATAQKPPAPGASAPVAAVRVELAGWEKGMLGLVLLLGMAMAGIGLASSYRAVADKARIDWGWADHAWMLPVAVDVSIIAYGLGHLLLIRFERPAWWVRLLPVGLTVLTIWLNWNTGANPGGKVSHAGVVIVWVGFTEYVAHLYGAHIAKLKGTVRDTVPARRWILQPYGTAIITRQMALWDLTYTEALELHRQRKVYVKRLTQRHGKGWRTAATADELLPVGLARWGITVDEALDRPAVEDAADAVRVHEAGVRARALALQVEEERATEALRAVERKAAIAAAEALAEEKRLLAEAKRIKAEAEARTAADAVVRAAEAAVRIEEARATAETQRLESEALAEAAKVAAAAEAEAAAIRRQSEEAQLTWQTAQRRRQREEAEEERLAELEATRTADEARDEMKRIAAERDAELSRIHQERAQADQAAAEAKKREAVQLAEAAEAKRLAAVRQAEVLVQQTEAKRIAEENEAAAVRAAAAAAEQERLLAEALEAAAVAQGRARRTPQEREAYTVAQLMRDHGEGVVTISYVQTALGLTHTTAQDRHKRARTILADGLLDAPATGTDDGAAEAGAQE
ncbi:DUF2637 domain-containing protein [Kitasatospora herbaricolor]|uniref:DUF2637 domain-containing protein n=1 Tax=Kitasatospora herbaricolor TaxID=68217 RepID=A0ABZ1WM04_9ACTN|nr:DUF2637 domain-containing protein [Kitasatospora herbaricolor]